MADSKQTAVLSKPADKRETSSHIPVQPLYTASDLEGWDYDREVGYPGQFPYTRGVQATVYRGRLWTMRQYAGMATPKNPTGATSTC
jgi:methylmalonyl-CoA mutase N-terminal domain/subunit